MHWLPLSKGASVRRKQQFLPADATDAAPSMFVLLAALVSLPALRMAW
jgi:hypothetical protein